MGQRGEGLAVLAAAERRENDRRIEAELERRCRELMSQYPREGSPGAREAGAGAAFWAELEKGCPSGRSGCAKRLMKLLMVSAKAERERDLKRLVACSEMGLEAAQAYACKARTAAERDEAWKAAVGTAGERIETVVGSRARSFFGFMGGMMALFAGLSDGAMGQAAFVGGAAALAVAGIWGSAKLAEMGGRWAQGRLEKSAA